MTETKFPNLTKEMGQLLLVMHQLGIAIRVNSIYNGNLGASDPQAMVEASGHVMWLSDILTQFRELGEAIGREDAGDVARCCETLVGHFRRDYVFGPFNSSKADPRVTIEKHGHLFKLPLLLSILENIDAKVST